MVPIWFHTVLETDDLKHLMSTQLELGVLKNNGLSKRVVEHGKKTRFIGFIY